MATSDTINRSQSSALPTQPQFTIRWDWIVVMLMGVFIFGAYLDSWAHNHLPDELETFFTPWHGVLYAGFSFAAGWHVFTLFKHIQQGIPWDKALPKGYQLSLLGIVGFAVGGVLDMFWHELLGIEVGLEGMISPPHLLLICSATLVYSGPLRAAWARIDTDNNWLMLGPAVLSIAFTISLFTLVAQFANILAYPSLIVEQPPAVAETFNSLGASSAVITTAILMGFILLAVRRWWSLPFGSITLILTLNLALVMFTRQRFISGYELTFFAAPLAGIIGDILLRQLRPSQDRPWAFRALGFAVPFVYFLTYFFILMATHGIRWSIHVWLGMAVLSGLVGLLISFLLLPGRIPTE